MSTQSTVYAPIRNRTIFGVCSSDFQVVLNCFWIVGDHVRPIFCIFFRCRRRRRSRAVVFGILVDRAIKNIKDFLYKITKKIDFRCNNFFSLALRAIFGTKTFFARPSGDFRYNIFFFAPFGRF